MSSSWPSSEVSRLLNGLSVPFNSLCHAVVHYTSCATQERQRSCSHMWAWCLILRYMRWRGQSRWQTQQHLSWCNGLNSGQTNMYLLQQIMSCSWTPTQSSLFLWPVALCLIQRAGSFSPLGDGMLSHDSQSYARRAWESPAFLDLWITSLSFFQYACWDLWEKSLSKTEMHPTSIMPFGIGITWHPPEIPQIPRNGPISHSLSSWATTSSSIIQSWWTYLTASLNQNRRRIPIPSAMTTFTRGFITDGGHAGSLTNAHLRRTAIDSLKEMGSGTPRSSLPTWWCILLKWCSLASVSCNHWPLHQLSSLPSQWAIALQKWLTPFTTNAGPTKPSLSTWPFSDWNTYQIPFNIFALLCTCERQRPRIMWKQTTWWLDAMKLIPKCCARVCVLTKNRRKLLK